MKPERLQEIKDNRKHYLEYWSSFETDDFYNFIHVEVDELITALEVAQAELASEKFVSEELSRTGKIFAEKCKDLRTQLAVANKRLDCVRNERGMFSGFATKYIKKIDNLRVQLAEAQAELAEAKETLLRGRQVR